MLEVLDPAIANDWFAVSGSQSLPANGTAVVHLFGHEIGLARGPDDALHAEDRTTERRCAAVDQYGCVWLSLGPMPKPLFTIPEFGHPDRRFLYMGGFGIHTGGLRVVENFLDMAHFPYVHTHTLGAEPMTEVRPYEAEVDAQGELWVRGCRFVQPLATAGSQEEADVAYIYRVVNPFTPLLYKGLPTEPDRQDIIFLAVQPVGEEECIAHFAISLFDVTSSDAAIADFQQAILGQDKPILESHVWKRLPLEGNLELPTRADAASTTFRNWLRGLGLRYGVLPVPPRATKWLPVRIAERWQAAEGVAAFTLAALDEATLPAAAPGAHVDVLLPDGAVRQYSVVNAGDASGRLQIAVKAEPESRGGSRAMHALVRGDRLRVGPPRNRFALVAGLEHVVLIAGGIGITPLLPMAIQMRREGRAFTLEYFCRSRAHAAFVDQLEQRIAPFLRLHVALRPDETRSVVEGLLRRAPPGAHVYTCGPAPLMGLVAEAARSLDWQASRVHQESFGSAMPVAQSGRAFEARLARSERVVSVGEDQSLVAALRDAGVRVPTSCEQGVCGTCLCRVVAGTPDHRDHYLTTEEKAAGDCLMLCVSRSLSHILVLDL